MKYFSKITALIALLAVISFAQIAFAQDPSDEYLNFYVTLQNAEKFEKEADHQAALARYQTAYEIVTKIKEQNPEWKKDIIDFRIQYVTDAVERMKAKVGPAASAVEMKPPPVNIPAAGDGQAAPPEVQTTESAPAEPSTPDPSKPVSVTIPPVESGSSSEEVSDLKKRISTLETELAQTKKQLEQESADKAVLQSKLEETERALAQARSQDFDKRIAELLQENSELKNRLAVAEDQIKSMQAKSDTSSADTLRTELAKVKEQLEFAQKENDAFKKTTEDLKKQLESSQTALNQAAVSLGTTQLQRENGMLKMIVDRQLKDQSRREAAKKLVEEEIQKLQVQSAVLTEQISLITSPYDPLTTEELAFFKAPEVTTNTTDPSAPPAANASTNVLETSSASISAPLDKLNDAATTTQRPKVPAALIPLTEQARVLFDKGDFNGALVKYNEILEKAPDNLYALSNGGVVLYQMGKLPEAEAMLKKAVTVAPNDAFSHSILGIVYYQQGKYDDAINSLTRAITIDPKNAQAHNYLGIACSQKGWQENAEKAMRRAIELDQNYADAHFNLAVVYATQKPPSKALARKHYQQAITLGMPKDPELEKMIQ